MKKSGLFLFETKVKWQHDIQGFISSAKKEPIQVAMPKVFKDPSEKQWAPENLLLGAISSCTMTTYLFYAKQQGLQLSGFECEVIGQVELYHGKLKFTQINIYPVIGIEDPGSEEKAKEVFELVKQNCLVAKAIAVTIYYHPVFQVMPVLPATHNHAGANKREVFF